MLQVIICEDNSAHREKIKKIIENTMLREEMDLKISLCTGRPQEVIEYIEKNNTIGIYFLDVDLKCSINGIRLGERIRKLDTRGFIIFTTTHLEMSYLAFKYKVEAMDYVIKDDDDFKERINSCLIKAYNIYYNDRNKDEYISINIDARTINVKVNNILFVETAEAAHKIRIHEEDRQIEFYGKLSDIQEKLGSNFYRCHKSYIVNRDKIEEVDRKSNKIILVNGEECYVSFRYIRGLLS